MTVERRDADVIGGSAHQDFADSAASRACGRSSASPRGRQLVSIAHRPAGTVGQRHALKQFVADRSSIWVAPPAISGRRPPRPSAGSRAPTPGRGPADRARAPGPPKKAVSFPPRTPLPRRAAARNSTTTMIVGRAHDNCDTRRAGPAGGGRAGDDHDSRRAGAQGEARRHCWL